MKFVPGLALVFDNWLKIHTLLTRPDLLDWLDAIETEADKWENVTISTHKYGGTQFNYGGKEIGHIHSNGLLDMLLSRSIKQQLMQQGRIQDHHSFKNTGWISFYIHTKRDAGYALHLLQIGHERLSKGSVSNICLPEAY
ncbi:hypothetical protein GSY63_05665 [Mucilaginibacter sp. R11]|uniref:Luciferase domain-containing protein n=1 Tax=Mucilaginibacter agri TaxID=2695265 RepID=A0A965ZFH9_9SPHI|nr:hypothetical protein [Mucilaginibacter agri]